MIPLPKELEQPISYQKKDQQQYLWREGRRALLCVHGITGSPCFFHPFLPLVPEDCTILNLLLPGHGQDEFAFSHSSIQEWQKKVKDALDFLREHFETIYVAGHSMGCNLLIEELSRDKSKVQAAFFFAVPFYVKTDTDSLRDSFGILFHKHFPKFIQEPIKKQLMSVDIDTWFGAVGIVPRMLEFYQQRGTAVELFPSLRLPSITVFLSEDDELVRFKSRKVVKKNPLATFIPGKNSKHDTLSRQDFRKLSKAWKEMFDQG